MRPALGLQVLLASEGGTWGALGSRLCSCQTIFGSEACRAGEKTAAGSVTVHIWHFPPTPQTSVSESPGTQRKVSLAGLALYCLSSQAPQELFCPPHQPQASKPLTYSPPWPLALGFSPAPVGPATKPSLSSQREENSKSLLWQ